MSDHPYGWLSLLPPVVAIVLAIATRRIVLSLMIGIFAGSLLMAGGNVFVAVYQTWETHLWTTLIDPSKLRVFSFTLLMGSLVGVITRSGGMKGLINVVSRWASNRRRGQLATWGMGLLVFFDDYANTILLGSTLRPICDRLKISREKLAYLVDSTAAPVAGVALVSTWVAVEIDYIANGLDAVPHTGLTSFGLFLASIPYRFYVLTALLLVPLTAWLGRDFGPMLKAERLTVDGQASPGRVEVVGEDEPVEASGWYHAVIPIVATLVVVVYFIFQTGAESVCSSRSDQASDVVTNLAGDALPDNVSSTLDELRNAAAEASVSATESYMDQLATQLAVEFPQADVSALQSSIALRDIVGAADSSLALQYGSLIGLAIALLMACACRLASLDVLMTSAWSGARVVLPAIVILWTASAMSRMTTDTSASGETSQEVYEFQDHRLYTAAFLTDLFTKEQSNSGRTASVRWLPTVVFCLAAVVAFCTGTSWGTMGILVPMVVQTSYTLISQSGPVSPEDPILLGSVAGVLAGAVFGDHCSPISDTTVLSSQASGCDHIAHVRTQMPYAMVAASVSVMLGTLPIGFGVSVWLLLPAQAVALILILRFLGRPVVPVVMNRDSV